MAEFKLPPISSLVGSTLRNYLKVLGKGEIDKKYYLTVSLTFLIIVIATPFHAWEWIYFKFFARQRAEIKPPLFILGHWRSGTTYLHNLLCQDPRAGYVTTYQSVFANNLASKLIFKTFMKISMPDKRPADNMALHVNYPQEDDFAVGNMCEMSYYNFFYFPNQYRAMYDETVRFTGKAKKKRIWKSYYQKLVEKALINTQGEWAAMKSPVNTGRVEALLEIFPEARFIYIYRNPYAVYLSTYKFFTELIPTLCFHQVSNEYIHEMILETYKKLLQDYERQKERIPSDRLIELQYEQFEKAPIKSLEDIYASLIKEDFGLCSDQMEAYVDSQKGHRKNTYQIKRTVYERISAEWEPWIAPLGYALPDNIEIVED